MAQTRARDRSRKPATEGSPRGSNNGSVIERREQAAAVARKKLDERRAQMSGVAGWIAGRSGDWSLDDRDSGWMEFQKYVWNPTIDFWFRMSVEGWEHIPKPPTLLIGIHSGAPFV